MAIEVESKQIPLVAHRDQKRFLAGGGSVDRSAVRAPMNDSAFRSPEESLALAVGAVTQDVIASVSIQNEECPVGAVESPGRTIPIRFFVFSRVARPQPLGERRTVERGFGHAIWF